MNVKINTDKYNQLRGNKTYEQIISHIENKWGIKYTISNISKCFTGQSKSYKAHALITDALGVDVEEVFTCLSK